MEKGHLLVSVFGVSYDIFIERKIGQGNIVAAICSYNLYDTTTGNW